MFEEYALEFFEITTQSKYLSFHPHPYSRAEICLSSNNKRCLVYYMPKMEAFLKYVASTYCMHISFLIYFIQKTIKGWRSKNKSFTL